jgi:small ligand-binding sensory domain FIST
VRWASACSDLPRFDDALTACAERVMRQLGGRIPSFATLFVSAHHAAHVDVAPQLASDALGGPVILGCAAVGVIGDGRELEGEAAVSLMAGVLPGVQVQPIRLANADIPSRFAPVATWERILGVSAADSPSFLIIPDPFTFDVSDFLGGLDAVFPGAVTVGGLASGGSYSEANALFLGDRAYRGGVVAVALSGDIEVEPVVAQGCRPIGQPMFVTSCDRNILRGLDGVAPAEILQQLHAELDEADRALFREALFLGLVMDPDQDRYGPGDFLVRNLLGLDPISGALQVGAKLEARQVVQFHVRDAETSANELRTLLDARRGREDESESAALLFQCIGRGEGLYGIPDHDSGVFQNRTGIGPLAGFFCNGEIGPVHGRTFLHGYTSAFAVLRPFRGRA